MNLRSAELCIDCDEVFPRETLPARCPKCGSSATAPVSRWLMTYEHYDRTIGPFLVDPERREASL